MKYLFSTFSCYVSNVWFNSRTPKQFNIKLDFNWDIFCKGKGGSDNY